MNALAKDAASNQPPKAVFFDVDGVLLDSLSPHLKFCRDKASEYKLPIQIPDEQQFRLMLASGFRGSPMAEFLRTAGFLMSSLNPSWPTTRVTSRLATRPRSLKVSIRCLKR
jgi:phosphoglycolate phosphatase-like HAD superfamily hydrolase